MYGYKKSQVYIAKIVTASSWKKIRMDKLLKPNMCVLKVCKKRDNSHKYPIPNPSTTRTEQ